MGLYYRQIELKKVKGHAKVKHIRSQEEHIDCVVGNYVADELARVGADETEGFSHTHPTNAHNSTAIAYSRL